MIAMWYLAVLLVCSLNVAFLGDHDSGPTCVKFMDRPEVHYLSLKDCKTRLRVMLESVTADSSRLAVPGPWKYSGKCVIPVIEEMGT